MIFCKIDSPLLEIIKKQANGRIVVDCGAGDGLLGSLMENVISLDIFAGTELADKPLSKVLPFDCETYDFPDKCLPVFIRPCHDEFVEKTIENNLEKFTSVLYVSEPKNIKRDLGAIAEDFNVRRVGNWVGADGEQVFKITINKEEEMVKKKFVLVKQFHGAMGQIMRIDWFELGEYVPKYDAVKLIWPNGFSFVLCVKAGKSLKLLKLTVGIGF